MNINKLFVLVVCILALAACSQQRYSFRKTIPANPEIARTEPKRSADREVSAPVAKPEELPAADSLPAALPGKTENAIRINPHLKEIVSAGTAAVKEIIPFRTDQLSPEEKHSGEHVARPSAKGDTPLLPLLAFIFALLSVLMMLLVIFVSSYTLGIILLFSAPAFAALGLILALTSLSDNNGKDMAMAALIISGMVLLIMLIVLLVSYLFLQSRNK